MMNQNLNNGAATPTPSTSKKRPAPKVVLTPVLLRQKDAATVMGVGVSMIQRFIKLDRLPYVPIGKLKLHRPDSLDKWAKAREKQKVSEH
jgi:hypothetical protein